MDLATLSRNGLGKKQAAGATGWKALRLVPLQACYTVGSTIITSVGKGLFFILEDTTTCCFSFSPQQSSGEGTDLVQEVLEDI